MSFIVGLLGFLVLVAAVGPFLLHRQKKAAVASFARQGAIVQRAEWKSGNDSNLRSGVRFWLEYVSPEFEIRRARVRVKSGEVHLLEDDPIEDWLARNGVTPTLNNATEARDRSVDLKTLMDLLERDRHKKTKAHRYMLSVIASAVLAPDRAFRLLEDQPLPQIGRLATDGCTFKAVVQQLRLINLCPSDGTSAELLNNGGWVRLDWKCHGQAPHRVLVVNAAEIGAPI